MGLIYLDSCTVIYLVENHRDFGALIERAVSRAVQSGDRIAISPLVQMEALVQPLRDADADRIADFEGAFARLELLPLTDETYRAAAQLRADHRLKTPDALHLACALHHRCTALWTNDTRLHAASGGIARALGELA